MNHVKTFLSTRDLILTSLFAVLIAICAWISIPLTVPFTLQTFGIFCTLSMLGGKRGTLAILVYLLLGGIGLPVFSGFIGGITVLFGTTGGYIFGFVCAALLYWGITTLFGDAVFPRTVALILGLFISYAFGTIWFLLVYTQKTGAIELTTALSWCVLPFLLPDLCKLALATALSQQLRKQYRL